MKPSLTLAEARQIIAAARAEAEKNQWSVSIAVVDDSGNLLALERADGAFPHSVELAMGKAWTAAVVRNTTKALEDMVKERPGLLSFPGHVRVQGGLPIKSGADFVGGVGVSGAASHQDEQCAHAGLAAIDLKKA